MKRIAFSTFLLLTAVMTAFGQNDYLDKGNTYLNNGQLVKAEETFRAGIKNDPNNIIYQCQLGLTLVEQKKYTLAEKVLGKILEKDSNNAAAIWYSGIGNFYAAQDRQAITRFEKALTMIDQSSGQYYSANWFIGTCYSNLLKTVGLTYHETDRMFACFEEYLKLQPKADDAVKIRQYVDRKKKRRPSKNVKRWIDL